LLKVKYRIQAQEDCKTKMFSAATNGLFTTVCASVQENSLDTYHRNGKLVRCNHLGKDFAEELKKKGYTLSVDSDCNGDPWPFTRVSWNEE